MNSRQLNAARFLGFADAYDKARPACPPQILEIARVYRGFPPRTVADVGCGTGLSTLAWAEAAREVVGIEPSPDMRAAAERAAAGCPSVRIQPGYGDDTCLPDGWADVVACSQSFHWMEPASTLKEAARILQPGGLFMAYDYDTIPLCNRRAETAYQVLLAYIRRMEDTHPAVRGTFRRWDKDGHLSRIRDSGWFPFSRELVFAHTEDGSADRLLALALSQGGVQALIRTAPQAVLPQLEAFEKAVRAALGDRPCPMTFSYRLRLGIRPDTAAAT